MNKYLKEYVEFNSIRFVKDSHNWVKEKKRIENQMDDVLGLSAIANDGLPHGTSTGDPTANRAIKLANLQDKLDAISAKIDTWEFVKSQLTESELDVLKVFFEGYGRIPYKIAMYGQKYGLCRSDVYKARRLCLERIKELVE